MNTITKFPTTKIWEEPNLEGELEISEINGSIDRETILEVWLQDEMKVYYHRIFLSRRIFMVRKTSMEEPSIKNIPHDIGANTKNDDKE